MVNVLNNRSVIPVNHTAETLIWSAESSQTQNNDFKLNFYTHEPVALAILYTGTVCVVCTVDWKHARGSYSMNSCFFGNLIHAALQWASLPAYCHAALQLLRGLGVAGPIISPWISLRRVSVGLIELRPRSSRAELWPTYSSQLWLFTKEATEAYSSPDPTRKHNILYIYNRSIRLKQIIMKKFPFSLKSAIVNIIIVVIMILPLHLFHPGQPILDIKVFGSSKD